MSMPKASCEHCDFELNGYKRNPLTGEWFIGICHHEDCPTIAVHRAKRKDDVAHKAAR